MATCLTRHTWAVSLAIFFASKRMRYCLNSPLHAVTISALTSLFLFDTMKSKQTIYSQIRIIVLVLPLCLQWCALSTAIIVFSIAMMRPSQPEP